MKKQNRNVFAYIRKPNVSQNQDPTLGIKNNKYPANQNMFNQIVEQMDQNLTKYLNKIVTKNQRQSQKKKSVQKLVNHQRTKSYADILVKTPTNIKNTTQQGHSHRVSHAPTQINNIFFSLNNSPINQQKAVQIKHQRKGTQKKNNQKYSFLSSLDTYITDLSIMNSTTTSHKKIEYFLDEDQRRFMQKTRQNSSNNIKIIQKLQSNMKTQKQLRIANQILVSQNQKLKNKLKKNKNVVKNTMQDLYQYAQSLSIQLKQQKRERKKLEQFIQQFQSKFIMLRPQRKTSGARAKIEQFLFSSTTEQDDIQYPQQCPSEVRSKSLKRRKVAAKSTAKHSRVTGFNFSQLSAMLASKNFQLQDEEQQTLNYQV